MDAGKTGDRNELQNHEDHREAGAGSRCDFQEGRAVASLFGGDEGAYTGEEEARGSADGAHVDEPAQRFTAKNRTGEADENAENDGVSRGSVLVVDHREPFGQIAVAAHGKHQAGKREIKAHDAGENGAGNADADQHLAEVAQQLFGRDEKDPVAGHHTVGPIGQRSGGNRVIGNVNKAAEGDGNDHDEADFSEGEVKLFRSLRDGVETDKGPRCNGKRRKNRGKNAADILAGKLIDRRSGGICGHSSLLVKAPDGVQIDALGLGADQAGDKQREDADDQQGRKDALNDCSLADADDVQIAKEQQNRSGEEDLSQIDLKSGNGIVEAEFEKISAAVKTIDNQSDGCAVHGHIGQVGDNQETAAQECGVFAEAGFGKCELAVRLGILGNHVGIAERDDDHDQRAQHHGDSGARDAGVRQKLFAGIDERTPSDDAAEGERPDSGERACAADAYSG